MLTKTMIGNSIELINIYLPNLWLYLNKEEFKTFLSKAFEHTQKFNGGTPNNNFIVTFFKLIEEHKTNNSETIRNEFGYFNYLLGKFKKYKNKREFRNLLIGVLYNFQRNNFHHTLGEIAVCLGLSLKNTFQKYEQILDNEKSIDFKFINNKGETILVDALTIDYNNKKYEKEKFKAFLNGRLRVKFEDKSKNLGVDVKRKIFVFPILSGFTIGIIKEQSEYLKDLSNSTIEKDGFQTFPPRAFGNVQGTFFSLFTIDEIIHPEKIKRKYSQQW
ncbi:hypothetical protein OOZ15_12420 [Galbibacter sp. EGI 63066]|uniref:hypothetical protein n=1 Tax=Galbibacter sp. EGI 63066 TaxID=2993559 RepID=UPI002248ACC1|nr:hypothetical protein [Galbibacter sp. EGI 63066]MCX2680749.1 hypothetical protein [Galbibacter sp. EGI 63066]